MALKGRGLSGSWAPEKCRVLPCSMNATASHGCHEDSRRGGTGAGLKMGKIEKRRKRPRAEASCCLPPTPPHPAITGCPHPLPNLDLASPQMDDERRSCLVHTHPAPWPASEPLCRKYRFSFTYNTESNEQKNETPPPSPIGSSGMLTLAPSSLGGMGT